MVDGTTTIETFMDMYPRQLAHYQQLAYLCASICEAGLADVGIRAIVTSRPKGIESLRTKLAGRQAKGKADYMSFNDINRDIPDLAGVRIALYFPGDLTRVRFFIQNTFISEKPRVFPLPPEEHDKASKDEPWRIDRVFPGYSAEHFRVRLRKERLEPSQQHFGDDRIEIQVASVLMHAWAEVEHDLLYKPRSTSPSEEEQRIIDELNGLIVLGERGLERLRRAGGEHLQDSSSEFKNEYELSAFLYSKFKPFFEDYAPDQGDKDRMGRLDILWELIRSLRKNNPQALLDYLSDFTITPDDEAQPFPQYSPTVINHALFGEYEASSSPHSLVNQLLYYILLREDRERAKWLIGHVFASKINPEARDRFERLADNLHPDMAVQPSADAAGEA